MNSHSVTVSTAENAPVIAAASNQSAIADEIKEALRGGASLTSAQLTELCPSAVDSTAVSRVIYALRKAEVVIQDGVVLNGKEGRSAQKVKRWRLAERTPIEHPDDGGGNATLTEALGQPVCDGRFGPAAEPHPLEKAAMLNGTWTEDFNLADAIASDIAGRQPATEDDEPIDATRSMIVAELADHMDTALIEYADAALASDPVWIQLRAVQQGIDSAFRQATDREDGR
jgi:hypothetical protein